jgi:hypothetical protein
MSATDALIDRDAPTMPTRLAWLAARDSLLAVLPYLSADAEAGDERARPLLAKVQRAARLMDRRPPSAEPPPPAQPAAPTMPPGPSIADDGWEEPERWDLCG